MKSACDIIKYGVVKPFLNKTYQFNSIDIETIDNELFILGYVEKNQYHYAEDNFYNVFNQLVISSCQDKYDILTWTRYDNTHLLKLLLKDIDSNDINNILLRIGKVTPIYTYQFNNYTITIVNIIKDSMILKIDDGRNKPRNVIIYNLKNLYHTNLETTAKNYKLDYYSKIGEEYHIINKTRYYKDSAYKKLVLKSNELDNRVIIDIANIMLDNFNEITNVYPRTIFTNGSIARSYLMAYPNLKVKELQFKSIYHNNDLYDNLLDYSMKTYHGGKIESYIIGYLKSAKIIDITTAYPYAMSKLPLLNGKTFKSTNVDLIKDYFYVFIRCDIYIKDKDFIHPIIVKNPINKTNISPYGYLENVVITKIEYDYLLENNVDIKVYDFIVAESDNIYPYSDLVNTLFNSRMDNITKNISLAEMFKTIINSLYGITYELTDVYTEKDNVIEWVGYRAGDFFNPIIASYITATIRTYLSDVSYNIIKNGGEVYLNMTDSIIYNGDITLDVFSNKKILGKFEMPEIIKDVIILGAGRYEYKKEFNNKYVIKNRGFSVSVKDKAFYKDLDLSNIVKINHRTFVSSFKATTKKFDFKVMGYLIDDVYKINPFNLGGKRVVLNKKVNLNKEHTKTKAIYLEKGVL